MTVYYLNTPIEDEDIEKLALGDVVYLSGTIYTSRDMGHLRIAGIINEGGVLPVDFKGSAIFHAGPVSKKEGDGWKLSVIGPTTSIRMEPYAKMVGELGVKALIGKGGMAVDSLKNFTEHKQVYLQAPPGCAVKLGANVTRIKDVCWLDMGMPEALWQLEVKHFGPLVVTMDCYGGSVYQNLKTEAQEVLDEMFD